MGSIPRGVRSFYAEKGLIRTIGAGAGFCGREIQRRCERLDWILASDRGRGYPLSVRVEAARHGFSAHQYLWLGLDDADPDPYLSSSKPYRDVNDEHIHHLHDKYVFRLITEPRGEFLPDLFGTIDNGQFSTEGSDTDDLGALLSSETRLVLKPSTGYKGRGVIVLEWTDGTVLLNGSEPAADTVSGVISPLDGYLVTEFVHQHDYAETIFPDATNTIRLHTIIDPETGDIDVIRPSHRFGSDASAPTDNWAQGGYPTPVDVETGELRRAITLDDPPRSRLDRHPDTGAQVAGVQVPHWNEVCDLVRSAADVHRYIPFVGWDVVVTADGPVLIEGNPRPTVVGLQLEDGILADPRFRKLLAGH